MKKKIDYKEAGVDIAAGEEAVDRIKSMVRTTFSENVITDLGKFGGFYSLNASGFKNPVLVSSIDGVGTKLKVAFLMQKHDTIGEDLVNHCINDILAGGAKPLFFLDYIGTGKMKPSVVEQIISGMVRGCKRAGCALIGGEMAEMPGFYSSGEYDVAGSIVGIVEKDKIINGSKVKKGDILIGLPSTGLHTNGYSLARKILFDLTDLKVDTFIDKLNMTVGQALLKVHKSYLSIISLMLEKFDIHGLSHITGGGLIGNTKRIVPEGLAIEVEWSNWATPPIFKFIQELGNVTDQEMRKTFNMGIGYVIIVSENSVESFMKALSSAGEKPVRAGKIV